MARRLRLNKQNISQLEAEKTRYYVMDTEIPKMGIAVYPTGRKSYFLQKRIDNKMRRHTIGPCEEITPNLARKKATEMLADIHKDQISPTEKKRAAQHQSLTVGQALDKYLADRRSLRPASVANYRQLAKEVFPDWLDKPMKDLTRDMIFRRHQKHGVEHGKYRANRAMAVLRLLYNHLSRIDKDSKGKPRIEHNPVLVLTDAKSWFEESPNERYLSDDEIRRWLRAIHTLRSTTDAPKMRVVCDYLEFIIFTGFRKTETASLLWRNVDLKKGYVRLEASTTKNGLQVDIPLSEPALDLLRRRHRNRKANKFVFPGQGKKGYITETRKEMSKITELSGVEFTIHVLRHTFITVAADLDINYFVVKKLVNQKIMVRRDVTARYMHVTPQAMQNATRRISNKMLADAGLREGNILQFNAHAN